MPFLRGFLKYVKGSSKILLQINKPIRLLEEKNKQQKMFGTGLKILNYRPPFHNGSGPSIKKKNPITPVLYERVLLKLIHCFSMIAYFHYCDYISLRKLG